jgi:hypothetical protein
MTVLSRDWYGFTNAVSMIISVMVRGHILGQHRGAIDAMVSEVIRKAHTAKSLSESSYDGRRIKYENLKEARRRHQGSTNQGQQVCGSAEVTGHDKNALNANVHMGLPERDEKITKEHKPKPKDFRNDAWPTNQNDILAKTLSKVLIIQSDSKAVTFFIPNELLAPPSVFIQGPKLLDPTRYIIVRAIGWLVFAVHIVSIGMALLASQLYTVILLVLPTVLLVFKVGCDDFRWSRSKGLSDSEQAEPNEFRFLRACWIGSRLKAEIYEWPESYEFAKTEKEGQQVWVNQKPTNGRSDKRMDLYAWLALSSDEDESMDKWDLFPHTRHKNHDWFMEYN